MIGKAIGNYVIERTLAHGGMGAVFVARDRTLGRQAAIKFLGDDSICDPDATRRFLDEARITASLQHPNIVTIFDFGEVEGRPYYVMELLTGSNLATLMRANGRFEVEQVGAYLDQICSGLHSAHALGVVHRDLRFGLAISQARVGCCGTLALAEGCLGSHVERSRVERTLGSRRRPNGGVGGVLQRTLRDHNIQIDAGATVGDREPVVALQGIDSRRFGCRGRVAPVRARILRTTVCIIARDEFHDAEALSTGDRNRTRA